jgi:hypothetical protein
VSVLCIDKRTGRVVHRQEFPYTTSTFLLSGDPQTKTIELVLSRHRVKLTFTDEPLPPPSKPDEASGLPPKLSDVARGLFKAVGKAVGDAKPRPALQLDDPFGEQPEPRPLPRPAPQPAPAPPAPR